MSLMTMIGMKRICAHMRMSKTEILMYDYLMENSIGFDKLNMKCQLYIINQVLSGNTNELFKLLDNED